MGSKEQLIQQGQQLIMTRERFLKAQDELDHLKKSIQNQQVQLDSYRNMYLQAQQRVAEQRNEIDQMHLENSVVSEQVNLEIQKIKDQFQEKLQRLAPFCDILKATQIKLQEAQQLHTFAEKKNSILMEELQAYKDNVSAMSYQMNKIKNSQNLSADERANMEQQIAEMESKFNEAFEENNRLKKSLVRMDELANQNREKIEEKLHEIVQLVTQLESIREDSTREVSRIQQRCELVCQSMQNQTANLQRQLAQSIAEVKAIRRERDSMRDKMQSQINTLSENFESMQLHFKTLQRDAQNYN